MTTKLFKAAEVCDMAQLQPYVLRSWEKEFPGIGLQRSGEGPRFYRQSDLDQVLRIKQLVFGEGLTLAGARRRLEELARGPREDEADVAEALDALSSTAKSRIAHVKQGLRSILALLDGTPRTGAAAHEDYQLQPPPVIEEQEAVGVSARTSPTVAKKAKRATG